MAEALQNSCNPVFVELALRLGTERMYQYLHAFGLGSKTNVDLQGEGSGILIPVQSVKNVDLARIGFGQSVAVTPIQLIKAACAVINGGRLMQPYLLKEAIAPDGTVLYRTQPKVVSNPISEETSATMREASGAGRIRRRSEKRGHRGLPHRRKDGHGAGLQGRAHCAGCPYRLISGLCPGG